MRHERSDSPRRDERPGSRTIRLTLAYEGTAFAGWQRQPCERTVQAVVEEALAIIDGAPVAVVAAGRTDAGVHARAQVASARLTSTLDPSTLRRALNVNLPGDVRVVDVRDATAGFNARHDAWAKTYHYTVAMGREPSPFVRRVVWHVPRRLDVDAMSRAASLLIGRHDFAAFQASGGDVKTTVRRLLRSELLSTGRDLAVESAESVLLCYRVTGTGFLRHMVRNIVGTLVEIGTGRWPPEAMAAILASGDRGRAGRTAPPAGLVLVRVHYRGEGAARE